MPFSVERLQTMDNTSSLFNKEMNEEILFNLTAAQIQNQTLPTDEEKWSRTKPAGSKFNKFYCDYYLANNVSIWMVKKKVTSKKAAKFYRAESGWYTFGRNFPKKTPPKKIPLK